MRPTLIATLFLGVLIAEPIRALAGLPQVLVCSESPSPELRALAMDIGKQTRVDLITGCPSELQRNDTGSYDLVVEELVSAVGPVSAHRTFYRRRVFFPLVRDGVIALSINGRQFRVALAAKQVEFPAFVAQSSRPRPEESFLRGLVSLHALPGWGAKDDRVVPARSLEEPRIATTRDAAAAMLATADTPEVQQLTPTTAAVIRQLRAALVLSGACTEDTAAGLFRSASRLVPFDAEARAAAALSAMRESYTPTGCPRALAEELRQGVLQDLWSQHNVDGLAQTYELATNAPAQRAPPPNEIDVEAAAGRLSTVWGRNAPRPPMGWEMGLAFTMSKNADLDPRDVYTIAPGARVDFTRGRDGAGWGFRLGFVMPWTRELVLGVGAASWTRAMAGVGTRYRWRLFGLQTEVASGILLGVAWARGHGFASHGGEDLWDAGLDVGAELGGRVTLARLSHFALWVGAHGAFYVGDRIPGWPDLQVRVNGLGESRGLPQWDVSGMVGLSWFLQWLSDG